MVIAKSCSMLGCTLLPLRSPPSTTSSALFEPPDQSLLRCLPQAPKHRHNGAFRLQRRYWRHVKAFRMATSTLLARKGNVHKLFA